MRKAMRKIDPTILIPVVSSKRLVSNSWKKENIMKINREPKISL